jgi:hypothetical protein
MQPTQRGQSFIISQGCGSLRRTLCGVRLVSRMTADEITAALSVTPFTVTRTKPESYTPNETAAIHSEGGAAAAWGEKVILASCRNV